MNTNIDELRKHIDAIDDELIQLLSKRAEIAKKIGEVKKELNMEILDENRWEKIVKKIEKKTKELHLDSNFVKKIFETIHDYSQKIQK